MPIISIILQNTAVKDDANTISEMSRIHRFCRSSLERKMIAFIACRYLCYFAIGCRHIPEGGIQMKSHKILNKNKQRKSEQGKRNLGGLVVDDQAVRRWKTLKGTFNSTTHLAGDLFSKISSNNIIICTVPVFPVWINKGKVLVWISYQRLTGRRFFAGSSACSTATAATFSFHIRHRLPSSPQRLCELLSSHLERVKISSLLIFSCAFLLFKDPVTPPHF